MLGDLSVSVRLGKGYYCSLCWCLVVRMFALYLVFEVIYLLLSICIVLSYTILYEYVVEEAYDSHDNGYVVKWYKPVVHVPPVHELI